jgi:hypothetical protein
MLPTARRTLQPVRQVMEASIESHGSSESDLKLSHWLHPPGVERNHCLGLILTDFAQLCFGIDVTLNLV